MFPQPQTDGYYDGFNERLYKQVPPTARRIIEVGCGRGRLGYELKRQDPDRFVVGVELDPAAAEVARRRLDQVFEVDIQNELPKVDDGSIDCILFGDVLEHLVDPEAILVGLREVLSDTGIVLVSVPNVGHYSIIRELLRADFMYQPQGLLDGTHLRFFTHATMTRLLLDAGFLPSIEDVMVSPIKDHDIAAARPLLEHLGMNPARARKFLSAFQYVFKGIPDARARPASPAVPPMTFAACVNDEQQLQSNLLRSPCLAPGSPHDLVLLRDCRSAAEGYNRALVGARNDLVVFVQQDMYLPRGWDSRFSSGFLEAEERYAPLGVAGVFGIRYGHGEPEHVGRVVDRDKLLNMSAALPGEVDGLDEIGLAVRRSTSLRFDPELGFHLYGTDICLSARSAGMRSAVVEAPCFHNSLYGSLSPAFHRSRERLLAKWPGVRPLHTNMGRLDTMEAVAPALTWQDEQNAKLLEVKRERDALGRELRQVRKRIKRIQTSRLWKGRAAVGKLARAVGLGRLRGRRKKAAGKTDPSHHSEPW